MDAAAALAVFDERMRRGARPDGPGAWVERVGPVVRQTDPGGWNGVLWSDLEPAGADTEIAAQVRHFAALGLGFEWKLYGHDGPADLAERLLAAGFEPEDEETVMVARPHRVPAGPEPPEGVRLLPVTDAAGVDLVAAVHEQVFATDPARLAKQLRARLDEGDGAAAAVVAMAGDLPVSAARMELDPEAGFAGLWGGGTLPGWRGRGLYRALVGFRARIAAERGCDWLQVDASAMSRPVLERLGFTALTTTTPYVFCGPRGG
ncbi:GNAT family N-acetyltransferase [Streptomyces meridianus]|uniref:GNAT family N-acetyltransferase n=1 Tax=Streptomyces meridianus TaxID=2938945 RepID=A0ABT0X4N9_9ACTN|nr:GNAT family N-acetyltransferase [Streptomyces meridianus]MCM2577497.1 GNAT family N-acetyltransferase [Streptomyces meridianus]